jgi:hypothetical protein
MIMAAIDNTNASTAVQTTSLRAKKILCILVYLSGGFRRSTGVLRLFWVYDSKKCSWLLLSAR